MSAPGGIGANAFDEGTWYHEILEDGLALSYRVRVLSAPVIVFSGETDGGGIGARRSHAGHPRRGLRTPHAVSVYSVVSHLAPSSGSRARFRAHDRS